MFVGLCAGGGDKYFFRLFGRVETSNEHNIYQPSLPSSSQPSTTENLSINHHHLLIFSINHHHHLISTIIISIITLCTHHRDNPISIHIFEWMQLPTLPTSTSPFVSTSYIWWLSWHDEYTIALAWKIFITQDARIALIPPQGRNLFIVDVFHIFDDAITADGRAIVDVAAQPSLTRCNYFLLK